ncbi:hypothetical protein FDB15_04035 [Clostridium botulinum]|uniref:hypothetical protein n=1 Tax=unclassified Clostridium TaxID=2614128 RepID=UPI0013CA9BC1|nr:MULTISPECIES: hypothetical protein [unclassified Clostridium]NFH99482.1 hypothetical protein [Clostridium botulinum]NFI62183.1 hypothetical protein [Clostridium botulinum]NFJ42611.1 hypothetical protein [Clostridium botulinum]NFJ46518.1 hypothetical protein [Clostridium botulinum]NFK26440.1 hypothetical protein [Clostridium botulinum]
MNKFNRFLSIINLIFWLGIFISTIFLNINLKVIAIGATFVVVVNLVLDLFCCNRGSNNAL